MQLVFLLVHLDSYRSGIRNVPKLRAGSAFVRPKFERVATTRSIISGAAFTHTHIDRSEDGQIHSLIVYRREPCGWFGPGQERTADEQQVSLLDVFR